MRSLLLILLAFTLFVACEKKGSADPDSQLPSVIISSVTATPDTLFTGEPAVISVSLDRTTGITENDAEYEWSSIGGVFTGSSNPVIWTAPSLGGNYIIEVTASIVTSSDHGYTRIFVLERPDTTDTLTD
jgi:hypothetical protein